MSFSGRKLKNISFLFVHILLVLSSKAQSMMNIPNRPFVNSDHLCYEWNMTLLHTFCSKTSGEKYRSLNSHFDHWNKCYSAIELFDALSYSKRISKVFNELLEAFFNNVCMNKDLQ